MTTHDDTSALTQLGSKHTDYKYNSPHVEMLETFPNQFTESDYEVIHTCHEWASLCPKTGQPDFGTITIRFIPDQKLVESKSLKLYIFAYRNEGAFMETLTNRIKNDLVTSMQPRWLEVTGAFNARGGIQTTAKASYTKPGYNKQ